MTATTTASSLTVRVPLALRRRPGRKTVVTPVREAGEPAIIPTRAEPTLAKALAQAERIERGYLGSLLRLTRLAPNIVEAILDGRGREGTDLPPLLKPFPAEWPEHRGWESGSRPSSCVTILPEARSGGRRGPSDGADFASRHGSGV